MMCRINAFVCLPFLFFAACSGGRDRLGSVAEIPNPSGEHAGQPNLSAGAGGVVYLTWIDGSSGPPSVKFAARKAQAWSEARTIVQSENLLVNWADFPSLFELAGGVLAAHWPSLVSAEGYNVSVALSPDAGGTWSAPITPHRDDTMTEHGFVALAPQGAGVGVVWLDSRKLASGSTDVALRHARIGPDGTLGEESEVDPRVCECCQPSMVAVDGGVLAVYRDRSGDEIRDIVVTKFNGSSWTPPRTVHDDGWRIEACPIQGPAIAAAGSYVAVAWFTGANEKYQVQLALSTDGGATFGAPTPIDEGNPVGRVDVAALEDGSAVAVWIEHTDRGGEVRAVQVDAGGTKREARTLGKTSLGNASGFPKVERSGDALIFAWTDTEAHRVRTALAP